MALSTLPSITTTLSVQQVNIIKFVVFDLLLFGVYMGVVRVIQSRRAAYILAKHSSLKLAEGPLERAVAGLPNPYSGRLGRLTSLSILLVIVAPIQISLFLAELSVGSRAGLITEQVMLNQFSAPSNGTSALLGDASLALLKGYEAFDTCFRGRSGAEVRLAWPMLTSNSEMVCNGFDKGAIYGRRELVITEPVFNYDLDVPFRNRKVEVSGIDLMSAVITQIGLRSEQTLPDMNILSGTKRFNLEAVLICEDADPAACLPTRDVWCLRTLGVAGSEVSPDDQYVCVYEVEGLRVFLLQQLGEFEGLGTFSARGSHDVAYIHETSERLPFTLEGVVSIASLIVRDGQVSYTTTYHAFIAIARRAVFIDWMQGLSVTEDQVLGRRVEGSSSLATVNLLVLLAVVLPTVAVGLIFVVVWMAARKVHTRRLLTSADLLARWQDEIRKGNECAHPDGEGTLMIFDTQPGVQHISVEGYNSARARWNPEAQLLGEGINAEASVRQQQ